MTENRKPHVVVLGGGLGGTICAYELREKLGDAASVSLVSDRGTFSFTPSNPWVAVGWTKPDDIEVELAPLMARKGIGFLAEPVERIEPDANTLLLANGQRHDYDYLVVASGPDLAFDEIPGLGPDAHTVSICRTDHANAAHDAFERFCRNPGPVIVGAAPGASCFGPMYEYAMMLDTELRRRKLRDRVPITVVTPEPYIGHLGLDGIGDTKGILESELRSRQIKWIANGRITSATEHAMQIEEIASADGSIAHDLPFSLAMVLPAFRGIDALRGIEGLVNPRGFVLVDENQRNPAYPNVFALGVCVAIPPVGPTRVPVGVPKTGFMIESMSAAVAANLDELIAGKVPTHRATWNAICLADFGDGGVAFVAQPQLPPRNRNWSAEGRWVHYAKIGFEKYFMHKIRRGVVEPAYERMILKAVGIEKLVAEPKVSAIGEQGSAASAAPEKIVI